jgi:hypothetical protein
MGFESLGLQNLLLAAQLTSAGGQIATGVTARSGARGDARTLRDIGRVSAQDVRREGERIKSSQRAAFGAAGVDPGSGTPLEVLRATAAEVELDALREQFRFETAAHQVEREGNEALTRSILGAVSTTTDALALRTLGGVGTTKAGARRRPRVAFT